MSISSTVAFFYDICSASQFLTDLLSINIIITFMVDFISKNDPNLYAISCYSGMFSRSTSKYSCCSYSSFIHTISIFIHIQTQGLVWYCDLNDPHHFEIIITIVIQMWAAQEKLGDKNDFLLLVLHLIVPTPSKIRNETKRQNCSLLIYQF